MLTYYSFNSFVIMSGSFPLWMSVTKSSQRRGIHQLPFLLGVAIVCESITRLTFRVITDKQLRAPPRDSFRGSITLLLSSLLKVSLS